jgi:hypothetical protein
MADSNFRGPINSMGSLEVDAATANVAPLDGPSLLYQSMGIPDLRSAPFAKDAAKPGSQPAFLAGGGVTVVNTIPQARGSTLIAAAQTVTSAVAVGLITAQAGGVASVATVAVGVPIVPIGTTVATFANLALDFGFTTGTTAANSTTVTVVDNTLFQLGQWIVIGGAGNSSASRSHIGQVISSSGSTVITVVPAPVTTILNAPIGQANLFGSGLLPSATQFGPSAPTATGHSIAGGMAAGLARVYNPREMSSRSVSIQSVTAIAVAYSAVVSGWDVWCNPMTEIISSVTGVTTFAGRKAFKYISSITSGTTVPASQGVAFGLGDTFGLPMRADYWEEVQASWNGSSMTNSNGFVPAISGTTVVNGTTDVRGTLMVSTAIVTGTIATAISAIATNGTGRLTIRMFVEAQQAVASNPLNIVPSFGLSQYTATT